MKRCGECWRRIWPWQSWSGWGPAGLTLRNADRAEHTVCMRRRGLARHQGEHQRTGACQFLGCPEPATTEEVRRG